MRHSCVQQPAFASVLELLGTESKFWDTSPVAHAGLRMRTTCPCPENSVSTVHGNNTWRVQDGVSACAFSSWHRGVCVGGALSLGAMKILSNSITWSREHWEIQDPMAAVGDHRRESTKSRL